MVISSILMKPCIWFHHSKQLSRRLAFYFNDFAYFFLKSLLCISIGGYKFFLNADAMAVSFSSETIKPSFLMILIRHYTNSFLLNSKMFWPHMLLRSEA